LSGLSNKPLSKPVQRYVRDAKVMEIIEGSTQMHEIWNPSMFVEYGGGSG
jgi:hypothetical protein